MGQMLRSRERVAWWRYPDDPDRSRYMRGVQLVSIDPQHMKPTPPLILCNGRSAEYYTAGVFLGWVDNIENREEGRTMLSKAEAEGTDG